MRTCYGAYTPLFCGTEVIWGQRGLQQGDPCAPVGYAWAMQDVAEAITGMVEWQAWYLDDAHIVGSPEQLHAAFLVLGGMAHERGVPAEV